MKLDAIQDAPHDDGPVAGPVWTYVLAGIAGTGLAGAIFGVSAGYWVTCGLSPCFRFYGADLIQVLSWVPMWGIVFGLVWGIAPSLWLARRSRKSRPVAGLRAWFMALLVALCAPYVILWIGEWVLDAVETRLAMYGASEAMSLRLIEVLGLPFLPFPWLHYNGSAVVTGTYILVSVALVTLASATVAATLLRALLPVSAAGGSPWDPSLFVGALAGGITGAVQSLLVFAGYLATDLEIGDTIGSPIVMAVYFGLLGGALGFLLGPVPAIVIGGVERFQPSWRWLRWPLGIAVFVATFQILVADFADRVRGFAMMRPVQNTRLHIMILVGGSVVYLLTTLVLTRWLHPTASEVGGKASH